MSFAESVNPFRVNSASAEVPSVGLRLPNTLRQGRHLGQGLGTLGQALGVSPSPQRLLPVPLSATHLLPWPPSEARAPRACPCAAPRESTPLTSRSTCSLCAPPGSVGWASACCAGWAGRGGARLSLLLSIPGDVVRFGLPASLLSLFCPTFSLLPFLKTSSRYTSVLRPGTLEEIAGS